MIERWFWSFKYEEAYLTQYNNIREARRLLGNERLRNLYGKKKRILIMMQIEMLQLLLRLGTFQLSDIFYNTLGGMIGGLMYCAVMKARKRL